MAPSALVATLRAVVGADGVVDRPEALLVYECDGYTLERAAPELVVLPRTPAEVSAVLRLLAAERIPFVPRGAGTGLSGGTLPCAAPVMICTSRMQAIETIDVANRRIVVQAGVVNQWVTNAVRAHGLCYAPDPSSQPACTIGGNIAENSGGPHTLKYGVTTNHALGAGLGLASGAAGPRGRRGRRPPDRAGRPRGRPRPAGGAGRRRLPPEPRARGARGARRGGACGALEMPQARLRRRRPARTQLLHAGRRRAADPRARHPAPHRGGGRAPPAPHRQRLPRRRRQHPPHPPLRRTRPGRGAARAGGGPRDPGGVHRARREPDRRARHRGREDGADAAPLRPRRPRRDGPAARRVRSRGARQPAQDLPRREGVRRDARPAAAGGHVRPWADIVGAEYVAPGGPVDGVEPAWVVRPGSVAEVRECVRAAARAGASLVVQGLGAHMSVGAPPARLDVVLGLDRLVRVVDHQAGDMTVTVEAGCTLAALATLGVIVEATFKVRPRPACEEAVVIAARSVEAAAETALGVMASEVAPLWLEVGGPGALPEGPGDGAAVVVGLAGIAEEVAHARARTLELARARGLRAITVADGAALRARLADFALEPAEAVLRAAMLPTEVGAFIARAGRSGAALRCLGHAASGVVRVAVPEARAVAGLVAALRPGLEARGGSLVVERATPEVKAQVDVWGDPGEGVALMRGIKAAFDPGGLFAPGRFVAGI